MASLPWVFVLCVFTQRGAERSLTMASLPLVTAQSSDTIVFVATPQTSAAMAGIWMLSRSPRQNTMCTEEGYLHTAMGAHPHCQVAQCLPHFLRSRFQEVTSVIEQTLLPALRQHPVFFAIEAVHSLSTCTSRCAHNNMRNGA